MSAIAINAAIGTTKNAPRFPASAMCIGKPAG